MGVIDLSAYKPVPATLGDANQVANGFQTIQTLLNGNVDNNNFGAGKIFDPLKIMQNAAVAGQALVWNAAANGGTGGWVPATVAPTSYRKTTAKTVNTTVAETDLLNGEITVAAGAIGASGRLRFEARGDWVQNSGGNAVAPRFKLKLGGTTLLDTAAGPSCASFATRGAWRITADIVNLGATNSQWSCIELSMGLPGGSTPIVTLFTTGTGMYSTVMNTAASANHALALGENATAVDTTAACALVLSVINGSASATYEIILKDAFVVIE